MVRVSTERQYLAKAHPDAKAMLTEAAFVLSGSLLCAATYLTPCPDICNRGNEVGDSRPRYLELHSQCNSDRTTKGLLH